MSKYEFINKLVCCPEILREIVAIYGYKKIKRILRRYFKGTIGKNTFFELYCNINDALIEHAEKYHYKFNIKNEDFDIFINGLHGCYMVQSSPF